MSTDQNEKRMLGGYKAALHNPNVSDEAKEHATRVLAAHGENVDKSDLPPPHKGHEHHHHEHGHEHHVTHESSGYQAAVADEGEGDQHDHRVLGGYKATVKNPNTSEEAKEHAAEVLAEHGVMV